MIRRLRILTPALLALLLADCATKELAEAHLTPAVPQSVWGDALQFTLVYNPGAAYGISLGEYNRLVFTGLPLVVIGMLFWLALRSPNASRLRLWGIGITVGGAVGNLIDRLRSQRGVVDFIDVGIGDARFWVFNLADVGVTVGAVLVAYTIWREDQHSHTEPRKP